MFDFEARVRQRALSGPDLIRDIARHLRDDLDRHLDSRYRADENRPFRLAKVSAHDNTVDLELDDDFDGLSCNREGPGMTITIHDPEDYSVDFEIASGLAKHQEHLTRTLMMDRVIEWLIAAPRFRSAGPFFFVG